MKTCLSLESIHRRVLWLICCWFFLVCYGNAQQELPKYEILNWKLTVENHLLKTNFGKAEFSRFGHDAGVRIKNYHSHITVKARKKYAQKIIEEVKGTKFENSIYEYGIWNDIALFNRYSGNYIRANQIIQSTLERSSGFNSLTMIETKILEGLLAYDFLLFDKARQAFLEARKLLQARYRSQDRLIDALKYAVMDIDNPKIREENTWDPKPKDDGHEVTAWGYTKDEIREVFQIVSNNQAFGGAMLGGKLNIFYLKNLNTSFAIALERRSFKDTKAICEELARNYPQFIRNNIGWYNTSSKLQVRSLLDQVTDNMLLTLEMYPGRTDIIETVLNYRINTKGILSYESRKTNEIVFQRSSTREVDRWAQLKADYAFMAILALQDTTQQATAELNTLNEYETELYTKYYVETEEQVDTARVSERQQLIEAYKKKLREEYGALAQIYANHIEQMVDQAYPETVHDEEVAEDFIGWKEIQENMAENSIFIDIVTYADQQKYGAFLLTKTGLPLFRKLGFTKNLLPFEKAFVNQAKNGILDKISYDGLFKPLGIEADRYSRIYFAPEGLYGRINLNGLYDPVKVKYLVEQTMIENLYAPISLSFPSMQGEWNDQVVLFGNPTFGEGYSVLGNTFADLPGTKKELDHLDSIFSGNNWNVSKLLELEAKEGNLRKIKSPDILHIATHGYYLSDDNRYLMKEVDPQIAGGLALANSNVIDPSAGTDELMTSLEISGMDLANTKLVVMSACETGLGEELEGEGVQGLQSSFLVAGSQSVIGTLWQVADKQTADFMQIFYKNLLTDGYREDLLRTSTLQFMERYPDLRQKIYYWAPFVQIR